MIEIIFPDFPIKVQVSKTRRAKYYKQGESIPLKYQNDNYIFKDDKLFDIKLNAHLIRNIDSMHKPRFQPLSYNKIGTRQKMTVLKILKEYMIEHLPLDDFKMDFPCRIHCEVRDYPLPLSKDLDNMHIYYKAFQDLMVAEGLFPDDSKLFITQSGGFTFTPINQDEERTLVFTIEHDKRSDIKNHYMFGDPQQPRFGQHKGALLMVPSAEVNPGDAKMINRNIAVNFGAKKATKAHTLRVIRRTYEFCMNNNSGLCVSNDIWKSHSELLIAEILDKNIPLTILTE